MSLSDGDPAPDGDIWFRIVTHQDHLRRGRVHHSAWGGNAISEPSPEKARPWTREASGRLRSRAGSLENIEHAANDFCRTAAGGSKTFSGVIYARVTDAKLSFESILTTAIHFTPLSPDPAHADLTFTGWLANESKEERARFNMWLSDKLLALHHPGQLFHLPDACLPPETATSRLKEFAMRCIVRICQAFTR
ncbi:MAG TPA: hypothetical protein VIE66_10150 [Methylocella sp.]|jgi:hypothetical protein